MTEDDLKKNIEKFWIKLGIKMIRDREKLDAVIEKIVSSDDKGESIKIKRGEL